MKKNSNSNLGLGTAAIGRPLYINIKEKAIKNECSLKDFRQKGIDLLEAAYQEGVRYFDTAPGYGMAEQMLLDWVIEKADDTIEVATKWGYTYVANFDPNAKQHEVKEHTIEKLDEQWLQSKNLLPALSSYQIHSATFETGVLDNEKILDRLLELKNEHDLLIGLTTTGANQVEVLKKAMDIELQGIGLFDVFQVTYNIFDQSLAAVAEELANQNKRLVIKEALANGRVFPNIQYPKHAVAYNRLSTLAKKYDVGIDAIALQFCLESIPVYKVLSGAAIPQHLIGNLKVANFELEKNDLEMLKELVVSPDFYWNERKQLGWN